MKAVKLESQVTAEQNSLIELAAAYQGRSVTDFVALAAEKIATAVIQDHEVLRLSREQSRDFVRMLLKPSAPNRTLRVAAKRFRRKVDSR